MVHTDIPEAPWFVVRATTRRPLGSMSSTTSCRRCRTRDVTVPPPASCRIARRRVATCVRPRTPDTRSRFRGHTAQLAWRCEDVLPRRAWCAPGAGGLLGRTGGSRPSGRRRLYRTGVPRTPDRRVDAGVLRLVAQGTRLLAITGLWQVFSCSPMWRSASVTRIP